MTINVCLAGATGWAGSELARGIANTNDVVLASAVSRNQAGRTLGEALGEPALASVPVYATAGEALGATVSGSQIHSVRLPGFVISAEISLGMPDQRLTIGHDSGSSARPYVDGAPLAIRKVSTLVGMHRGPDAVLDL